MSGDKSKRQKYKCYPIGYYHIDIAEVRTEEGKLHLFVGINRTSKFAVLQLIEKANYKTAWEFLERFINAMPYKIHTILTDNAVRHDLQNKRYRATSHQTQSSLANSQVERMNRTIKGATVKRGHYYSNDQLRRHLADFQDAYNF